MFHHDVHVSEILTSCIYTCICVCMLYAVGDVIVPTPVTQSFLSRLVAALTPAPRQEPSNTAAATNKHSTETAQFITPHKLSRPTSAVKRRPQTEGRKRDRENSFEPSRVRNSIARPNRKRKREENINQLPDVIEMKQFPTRKPLQPLPQWVSSPALPVSPSLPPPFCLSPSPAAESKSQCLQEMPLRITPVNLIQTEHSLSSVKASFGSSPLRRSGRLAQCKGRSPIVAKSFRFESPVSCMISSPLLG